ncbi:MAG: ThiF family adenylyltransferase [Planctomycetia bacterium]|nr:ThiF family adenylyltransferase [Planctomycetia bacterium]
MPNSTPPLLERDTRQREIVPPDRLADCHALVIGVGAIGRQVALQLAALGMPRLTLVDPDDVRVENLAPQGYLVEDLQALKVEATATLCRRLNPAIQITPLAERFQRSSARNLDLELRLVVYTCVDRIVTRRLIWEALRHRAALFLDGRMSAEVIRVLAVAAPAADRHYPQTLFNADEAYAGSCTARSTIYTASIAAGLMLGQMTKWLRGLPVDAEVMLNLLAAEWTIGPIAST